MSGFASKFAVVAILAVVVMTGLPALQCSAGDWEKKGENQFVSPLLGKAEAGTLLQRLLNHYRLSVGEAFVAASRSEKEKYRVVINL